MGGGEKKPLNKKQTSLSPNPDWPSRSGYGMVSFSISRILLFPFRDVAKAMESKCIAFHAHNISFSYLVGFAVRVEISQPVETFIVLRETAQAQMKGGDALLCQELPLLLQIHGKTLRKLVCTRISLPFRVPLGKRGG